MSNSQQFSNDPYLICPHCKEKSNILNSPLEENPFMCPLNNTIPYKYSKCKFFKPQEECALQAASKELLVNKTAKTVYQCIFCVLFLAVSIVCVYLFSRHINFKYMWLMLFCYLVLLFLLHQLHIADKQRYIKVRSIVKLIDVMNAPPISGRPDSSDTTHV